MIFEGNASGKVLLVGGYLILDSKYKGLVVATSSQFKTTSKSLNQQNSLKFKIKVSSPQFTDGQWDYSILIHESDYFHLELIESCQKKNPFLEIAIQNTFLFAIEQNGIELVKKHLSSGIEIKIQGDNSFYSQRNQLRDMNLPLSLSSLKKLSKYSNTKTTLKDVHKTGLGSSAAMITSLIASLCFYMNLISEPPSSQQIDLVHKLSQFSHCLAQGKIGSGFDVSAAIYGSHCYQRFSPTLFESLLNQAETLASKQIHELINKPWDYKIKPFKLAPGLNLCLGEIDMGSSTPSLVSKVLEWKKNQPEQSNELFEKLNEFNEFVMDQFYKLYRLSENEPELYTKTISEMSGLVAKEWKPMNPVGIVLINIWKGVLNVRENLRLLGTKTGVPIEPPLQTKLLDACLEIPGVLCAGVPGAGGFDAIFVIHFSNSGNQDIENVFSSFNEMSVCPLLCSNLDEAFSISTIPE